MKYPFVLIAAAILAACSTSVYASVEICVEFEDVAANIEFTNADLPAAFVTESISVELTDAGSSAMANALIGTYNYACGSGNELCLYAHAKAELELWEGSTNGNFRFADLGGDNYLLINGSSIDFDVIRSIANGTVGGVSFQASAFEGYSYTVNLTGHINTLAFIGEELAIDNVSLQVLVPEPSCFILWLGVLVAMLPSLRRKHLYRAG